MIFNPIKHVLGFGGNFDSIRRFAPLSKGIDEEKTLDQLCIENGCDLFTIYLLNDVEGCKSSMNLNGLTNYAHGDKEFIKYRKFINPDLFTIAHHSFRRKIKCM